MKSRDSMQAKLTAVAASVGLTWDHVSGMTFRRFAEMVARERARREGLGEEMTIPGIGVCCERCKGAGTLDRDGYCVACCDILGVPFL